MTAISMHAASVPLFRQLLWSLDAVLQRGAAFEKAEGREPSSLLQARLAPDMLPLVRQVQIACDAAKAAAARLGGVENPRYPDDEASFADLHGRIAKTLAFLDSVAASAFDGSETRVVTVPLGREQSLTMEGLRYLMHWAIPNFTFHVTTAYAILRQQGVQIGKRDFLGPMDAPAQASAA